MSGIKIKNIMIIILALSMLGMITGCDKKESDKTIESQTTKVESTTTEKGSKEKVVKGTEEKKTTTKKDKLKDMSEDEQLKLLATDGMLVKRPLVIGDDFVLTGFREKEWSEAMHM